MEQQRYYHRHHPKKPREAVEVKGDKAVLALPVEELGLSENVLALLKNGRVATVYDLCARTEKDMYKIQTFGKKHLLEVKAKMKEKGVDFLPPLPPKNPPAEKASESVNAEAKQAAKPQKEAARKDNKQPQPQPQRKDFLSSRGQKPEKPTAPKAKKDEPKPILPLKPEEWKRVNKNGKWGFHDGLKTVIQPSFDEVFMFHEGLASVEENDKFGYIGEDGEWVIEPTYDCAMSFSEGLASVQIGDKCGYIDKQNVLVIPCVYDACTQFENGRAKVKQDGSWGTIDKEGKTVWNK